MWPSVRFINRFATAAHADLIRKSLRFDAMDDADRFASDLKARADRARTGNSGRHDGYHSALTEHMNAERLSLLKSLE